MRVTSEDDDSPSAKDVPQTMAAFEETVTTKLDRLENTFLRSVRCESILAAHGVTRDLGVTIMDTIEDLVQSLDQRASETEETLSTRIAELEETNAEKVDEVDINIRDHLDRTQEVLTEGLDLVNSTIIAKVDESARYQRSRLEQSIGTSKTDVLKAVEKNCNEVKRVVNARIDRLEQSLLVISQELRSMSERQARGFRIGFVEPGQ